VEEVLVEAQQRNHYDIAIHIVKETKVFNTSQNQLIHPPQDPQNKEYLELLHEMKEQLKRY
jgi:hypothetical protein